MLEKVFIDAIEKEHICITKLHNLWGT
jgi:hypothetical protein